MNVEMMLKVADYIEAHPENYNQQEWCGSVCCVAGHAIALHHADVVSSVFGPVANSVHFLDCPLYCISGTVYMIPDLAGRLLGIDVHTANILFGAGTHWPAPFTLRSWEFPLRPFAAMPVSAARKAAAYLRYLVQEEMLYSDDLKVHSSAELLDADEVVEDKELVLA